MARELAAGDGFSLLCGRYEGVDHRVREHLVDGELSVGDVVLGGGEVAACVVIEAVARLLPGAMGNDASPVDGELRRRRAARGAAVHPARPSSGAGRCPRCCAAATTAGSSVAAGAGAAPHAARPPRPDRARAAACTDEDRRCWKSSPPSPYP